MGGRIANSSGSGAMYDTLVNLHSGPRVLGESYSMHALPGKKKTLVDDLALLSEADSAAIPTPIAKLDASKGKFYEFTGRLPARPALFRLRSAGEPEHSLRIIHPIGPANAPVGSLPWPQVNKSPVLFNTVRRMTDTNLTLTPFATIQLSGWPTRTSRWKGRRSARRTRS